MRVHPARAAPVPPLKPDDRIAPHQLWSHLSVGQQQHVRRVLLGDPSPWAPLDLPWDEMPDTPGIPRDRDARPALDVLRRRNVADNGGA